MYRIGIDVGSTYTKYCVMQGNDIGSLFMERTPIRQKEYFEKKICDLQREYPNAEIISCGYGKRNVERINSVNELTALARGSYFVTGANGLVLDIGGQDTKIIAQEQGRLKEFFINDKCAAGSGMFLTNIIDMIGMNFEGISLKNVHEPSVKLSSVCAVFAQSEIVELIANNYTEEEILKAVIWQIFVKAKPLLDKVNRGPILLSGGMSQIEGISSFAEKALGRECYVLKKGAYLAAVGCVANINK